KMEQMYGFAPRRRCSSTVARPPVKAFMIFSWAWASVSVVKMLDSGIEADILPVGQQARQEFVVDQGRLRISELGRDVSRNAEMGVLVDPAGNEDGDLVAGLRGRQEGGRRLDARIEDLADVVGVLEPEDRLGRGARDPLRDLHRDRIE